MFFCALESREGEGYLARQLFQYRVLAISTFLLLVESYREILSILKACADDRGIASDANIGNSAPKRQSGHDGRDPGRAAPIRTPTISGSVSPVSTDCGLVQSSAAADKTAPDAHESPRPNPDAQHLGAMEWPERAIEPCANCSRGCEKSDRQGHRFR
jgi:hypothetical protein